MVKIRRWVCMALACWRSERRASLPNALWFVSLLAVMAGLDYLSGDRILSRCIWLVPPFAATLSILLLLPASPIAQPLPVVIGSTVGAGIGSIAAMAVHGPIFAVVAAALALLVLSALRTYHPPGVALSMYPLLLYPGHLFAIEVVLPFTLVAVGSSALLSRYVASWPRYPLPLEAPPSKGAMPGSGDMAD
jgi:CBS-domain-containing membrane protein